MIHAHEDLFNNYELKQSLSFFILNKIAHKAISVKSRRTLDRKTPVVCFKFQKILDVQTLGVKIPYCHSNSNAAVFLLRHHNNSNSNCFPINTFFP